MKEESGFGFKDAAKAEETLRLLEQHEPGYRRLTVRGLLGRAKRVLSLTKAEDKIKNIKEAMEVFENWLADLDKNKEKKPENKKKEEKKKEQKSEEKKSSGDEEPGPSSSPELPPEGVPGLGFKDPAAARATLEALEGRDPDYQLLAVRGLLGRARRVLTLTKDETKLSDIKAAIDILEQFTREYESSGMAAKNNPWLGVGFVRTAQRMAADVTDEQRAFLAAYTAVRGEYKRLRNVPSEAPAGTSWDRVRNKALQGIREKHATAKLFDEKNEPTKEHLEMLVWAYSPDANRVKKQLKETKDEEKCEKMDHDGDQDIEPETDEKNKDGAEKSKDGGDISKDGDTKKKDGDDSRKDREKRHDDEKKKDRSSDRRDRDEIRRDRDDERKDRAEKRRDSGEKRRHGDEKRSSDRSDRKRRSSARSDDESHSKKRRD